MVAAAGGAANRLWNLRSSCCRCSLSSSLATKATNAEVEALAVVGRGVGVQEDGLAADGTLEGAHDAALRVRLHVQATVHGHHRARFGDDLLALVEDEVHRHLETEKRLDDDVHRAEVQE